MSFMCLFSCVCCVYGTDLSPISLPQTKPFSGDQSAYSLTTLLVDQVLRFQHAPLPLSVDCTLAVPVALSISLCLCCTTAACFFFFVSATVWGKTDSQLSKNNVR